MPQGKVAMPFQGEQSKAVLELVQPLNVIEPYEPFVAWRCRGEILADDVLGVPLPAHHASVEPDSRWTQRSDDAHVVADEQHRPAFAPRDIFHLADAFLL